MLISLLWIIALFPPLSNSCNDSPKRYIKGWQFTWWHICPQSGNPVSGVYLCREESDIVFVYDKSENEEEEENVEMRTVDISETRVADSNDGLQGLQGLPDFRFQIFGTLELQPAQWFSEEIKEQACSQCNGIWKPWIFWAFGMLAL